MKIATILVCHGQDKEKNAEAEIDSLFRLQLPDVERVVVIVDNGLESLPARAEGDGRWIVGGDNRFREFSGWDKGLRVVESLGRQFDLIHLATTAFNTLYNRYLERFGGAVLNALVGRPVCVGHIDSYNEPVRFSYFHSQHWIRTSFVFLPLSEIQAMGSLVTFKDGRMFFSGDPGAPFRGDAPLSPNYREYITGWLTGSGTGQGVKWHSTFQLTDTTLPLFESKALAILNEHAFSARLRALGCRTIDATWLASRLRKQPVSINWSTSWRHQLAQRDTDAFLCTSGLGPRFLG